MMRAEVFAQTDFDFVHLIPRLRPNSPLRGHTSIVRVYVSGRLEGGVVVDLGLLRKALEEVVAMFRNKVVVPDYAVKSMGEEVEVACGKYFLRLPAETVVVVDGEPTIEMIALIIAKTLSFKIGRCSSIEVELHEGARLGARVEVICDGGSEG